MAKAVTVVPLTSSAARISPRPTPPVTAVRLAVWLLKLNELMSKTSAACAI